MEVHQAEFARMAGVSRATISEKVKAETLVCNSAGLLDSDNVVNRAYLDKRRQADQDKLSVVGSSCTPSPTMPSNGGFAQVPQNGIPTTQPGAIPPSVIANVAGVPEAVLGLTIRELVMWHGNLANMEKYVRMLKDLTAADEKEQKTRERRLGLVDKDFVISRLFAYIDVLMNQLLDFPESVVDLLIAKVLSGHEGARAEIVATTREGLTRIITGAKETIIKEINGLRMKYQNADPLADIRERLEETGRESTD